MPIYFFQSEFKKIQKRFNETFGRETVCDIKLRQSVILAICWMGVLKRKIHQAPDKDLVREEIQKFMKAKKILHNLFDQFEKENQGRRQNELTSTTSSVNTKGI